jgi:hypothetical protein
MLFGGDGDDDSSLYSGGATIPKYQNITKGKCK